MAASATDDAAARVRSGIIDLRLLLRDPRLRGERRRAIQTELETLRLAVVGVRTKDTRAVLLRHGVTRDDRSPRLVRGPETWGDRVAVHVRGGSRTAARLVR
jgi:hypothetical protein